MIVLPWPAARLSPNARVHWRVRSGLVKKARRDAHYAALDAAPIEVPDEGPIPIIVRFYPPDNRRRDADNLIASLKSAMDGIADALAVDDHRFLPHYFFEEAQAPGRVEVHFGAGA